MPNIIDPVCNLETEDLVDDGNGKKFCRAKVKVVVDDSDDSNESDENEVESEE